MRFEDDTTEIVPATRIFCDEKSVLLSMIASDKARIIGSDGHKKREVEDDDVAFEERHTNDRSDTRDDDEDDEVEEENNRKAVRRKSHEEILIKQIKSCQTCQKPLLPDDRDCAICGSCFKAYHIGCLVPPP